MALLVYLTTTAKNLYIQKVFRSLRVYLFIMKKISHFLPTVQKDVQLKFRDHFTAFQTKQNGFVLII